MKQKRKCPECGGSIILDVKQLESGLAKSVAIKIAGTAYDH